MSVQHFGHARVRADSSNVTLTNVSHMAIDVRVAREKTCPYAVASDLSSRDIPPLKIVIDQSVKGTQGTYDIKAPNGEIVVGTDDLTGALYPSDGTIMPAAGPFSYSRVGQPQAA